MNSGFAAAHGIGADPLADKPKVVYVANPPTPPTPLTRALNLAVPETRAVPESAAESGPRGVESRDQSDWETDQGSAKDESDADEVIEEDLPMEPTEPDVVVSPPGGLHDSAGRVDRCRRRRLRCTNRPRRRRRRRPQRVTHV